MDKMNKVIEIIKRFSKSSSISEKSSVTVENDEIINKFSSSFSPSSYSNDRLMNIISKIKENEKQFHEEYSRHWRFIPNPSYFLNNISLRLSTSHKLKYMRSVSEVLEEINKNTKYSDYDINLILFIDIDNWGRFFKIPELLPKKTYAYCFKGGKNGWKGPTSLEAYNTLLADGMVSITQNVGRMKDAADFALTLKCGELHRSLPLRIGFLIISGDYGLSEIVIQMRNSKRVVCFVNPHEKKGKYDRHYDEKLDDDFHLLDIIRIMNYLALLAENDEEVIQGEKERVIFFDNNIKPKRKRLSNLTE